MHEASLMRDLMTKIEDVARQENARHVVAVDVWLGALSHMSDAHFREHFEHASAGTLAEGAEIRCDVSEDLDHPNAQDILLTVSIA